MPDRVTYEYAIIRVVPKVEREEFLNVGVLLFSKPKKYLDIKYYVDQQRLLAFSTEIDLDLVAQHLHAWELICKGDKDGGPIGQQELPYRFRWLTANRSTILQCSKTHPGLCYDPKTVLKKLFERYVL